MKSPAGYLVRHHEGLRGERGSHYDYVLAGNGIWVEAEGPLLAARVLVASAEIKGLPPLQPRLVLRHGRIPGSLFDLAVGLIVQYPRQEIYVGIYWSGEEYRLWVPNQQQGATRGDYERREDQDETGFQVYGVVGNLPNPTVVPRFGVYGYHQTVRWGDVFTGSPTGVEEGPKPGAVWSETMGWVIIPTKEELLTIHVELSVQCWGPWAIEHAACPQTIYQAWHDRTISCPCACHLEELDLEADKALTLFADEHLRPGLEPRESGFIASVLELRAALIEAGIQDQGN